MSFEAVVRVFEEVFHESFPAEKLKRFLRATRILNPKEELYRERVKKLYEATYFAFHVLKSLEKVSKRRSNLLLDCGCGRSYVSFILNYLLENAGRDVNFMCVDRNPALVKTCVEVSKQLGFRNMEFHASNIWDLRLPKGLRVDVTYALHACDIATDEAIAKGISMHSRFILVAPCCQRQVTHQLSGTKGLSALKGLWRHHVLKEGVGALITDELRALALETLDYKVAMFLFVSSRVTPKNLMLRAEKKGFSNPHALTEYRALRDLLGVKPWIERLIPALQV